MGGCGSKSPPAAPEAAGKVRDGEQNAHLQHKISKEIAELVRKAGLDNEHTAKVVPCEWSGELHDNTRGTYRDFCSANNKREWFDHYTKQARAAEDELLERWQDLDADFIRGNAAVVGLVMPPLMLLVQNISAKRKEQEDMYDKALKGFLGLDNIDLCFLVDDTPELWPAGTEQEVKDFCVQPASCVTMRASYLCGLKSAQHLFQFTRHLASAAGCPADGAISFGVKKPNRFRCKATAKFQPEVTLSDFRHVSDVYRASLVAETGEQLARMLAILRDFGRNARDRRKQLEQLHWRDCQEYFVVERIKNRFAKPAKGGYRDVIVNLRVNGYVCELQLHLKVMYDIQKEQGVQLAKWFKYYDEMQPPVSSRPTFDEGNGTTNFSSGTYRGELANSERNGQGTFLYNNGDRFEGQWVNGMKHGSGTYFYTTGDKYIGEFVDDRMHGQGKFTSHSHEWYEGAFVDGRRHGEGKWGLKDGSIVEGRWWRNKRVEIVST